jgi:hypothetical protein
MMAKSRVIEIGREVDIPRVGRLFRVERCSEDGESLGVDYRRAPDPGSSAVDLGQPFVVFVSASGVSDVGPNRALPDWASRSSLRGRNRPSTPSPGLARLRIGRALPTSRIHR